VEVRAVDEAGDYILHMPAAEEIEAAHARFVQATLENVNDSEATRANDSVSLLSLTSPVRSIRRQIVTSSSSPTHSPSAGWSGMRSIHQHGGGGDSTSVTRA
jgi:hypothetical protein